MCQDVATNIQTAGTSSTSATEQGAQIILLPELFERPYFCQEHHYDYYYYAAVSDCQKCRIQHFKVIAKELEVVLPIDFYEKDGNILYNSIAVIDAGGEVLGVYRRPTSLNDHYYQEKFLFYIPATLVSRSPDTHYAKVGIGICWDQWFPETTLAHCLALMGQN